MGCPAIDIANPKRASRAIPAPARRASARGPVSLRRTKEKRHRYGGAASSGSYVANDPVNATDPTGMIQDRFDQMSRRRDIGDAAADAQNRRAAEQIGPALGIVLDFIPVVGDIKGAVEFLNEPSWTGAAAVAVGFVPGIGDAGSIALRNSDLVVRGGSNTAEALANGSGVVRNTNGTLSGLSVNSAPGATAAELGASLPHRQIGVTTVGDIRAAGGSVTPSPTSTNPTHCTVCGITPEQGEALFRPTVPNPNPRPR